MNHPLLLDDEVTQAAPPAEPMETDEALYELVQGRRVEMPPMSFYAGTIAARLVKKLGAFTDAHQLGEVVGEVLFRLPLTEDQGRNRRPDVAFVSFDRWPADRVKDPDANAWDVVPDLAVEVVSPSDLAEEQLDKVLEYFRAGTRLVWAVYPKHAHVYVYEAPTRIRVLTRDDALDGGAVLPGFRLPLSGLFDPPPPAPSAA